MLYSEFVENTGCKQTDYNYSVYKRLEAGYNADESCTKEWVYEAGKKLVDNSLTEEEKKFNENIKEQIENDKKKISENKSSIENCKEIIKYEKANAVDKSDREYIRCKQNEIKYLKEENCNLRIDIEKLKMCIVK